MRDIKYRGKSKQDIETSVDGISVGDWVYGYYYYCRIRNSAIIVTTLQEESGGVGSGLVQVEVEVEKNTVNQFTGVYDRNETLIYEGDIVQCEQAQGYGAVKGVVHFGVEDRFGWCDPRIYLDTRPFQDNGSEFCIFHLRPEVIGNIYEDPNLLPSKETVKD